MADFKETIIQNSSSEETAKEVPATVVEEAKTKAYYSTSSPVQAVDSSVTTKEEGVQPDDSVPEKPLKTSGDSVDSIEEEFSESSDEELPDPETDYDFFLTQFVHADDVRSLILHFANVRAAELEHRANCWKQLRVNSGEDLHKLLAVIMKEDGAATLEKFEENAFIKPYAKQPFNSDAPSYPAYVEQFFPAIAVKNYFPELGKVTGRIPADLQGIGHMLTQQAPLVIDPKHFETKTEKTKVEVKSTNNKKKTQIKQIVTKPEPLFTAEQLKKCVAVKEWVRRYQAKYENTPTNALLLHQLNSEKSETPDMSTKNFQFALISDEFHEVVEKYKEGINENWSKFGQNLAINFIKRRLEKIDKEIEPTMFASYTRFLEEMNDDVATHVNAIWAHHKDSDKFGRLEKCLFLHHYQQ
ncbi:unnamed protein product [Caenorhabditis sp. 36 PRJEB53466]|nr:unnamed protein product [Caenorhabditis sp. 36 PRJEB53466]